MRGILTRLSRQLRRADARFLADLDFRVVGESHDWRMFGNAVLELENTQLRLRIVRDRGEVWVDAGNRASARAQWASLCSVAELLDLPPFEPMLANWTAFVRAHYAQLVDLFSDARYAETVHRAHERDMERTRAMLTKG